MTDEPEDVDAVEAEIEHEVERLESELDQLGRSRRRAMADRLQRIRRRRAEGAPDALFAPSGETGLRGIARRTDSYGFVLVLLAALIWGFIPFASEATWATIPTIIVFWASIIISLHTSYVREARMRLAIAVTSALVIVSVIGVATDNDALRAIDNAGFGIVLFLTAMVILRRILSHGDVSSRTISGAVAVYLFVGLAFASVANALELHDHNAYTANSGVLGFPNLVYFSFVTLATLGYGDIVPITSMARSLATMEAVLGQIYLVTIVARLVSLFGVGREPALLGDEPTTGDADEESS